MIAYQGRATEAAVGQGDRPIAFMGLRPAEIHQEKSCLGIERLTALLVPAFIIALGGAVAGIVSSLVLATLSLNDLASSGTAGNAAQSCCALMA